MSRFRRIFIVADNHGWLVDKDASEAMFAHLKDFKPDDIIHLGDNFDLPSLRSSASAKDENISLYEDFKAGLEFLERLRPTHVHDGNHDDRMYHVASSTTNGPLRDYCEGLIEKYESTLRRLKVKVHLPYDSEKGVLRLGPITTIHGYVTGDTAIEKQAAHFGTPGGVVIGGHEHTMKMVNVKKHGGVVAAVAACLLDLDNAEYAKRWLSKSKWANGWMYGYYNETDWKLWHAHKVGGQWCYTTSCTLDNGRKR